ncbi:hypothetical protein Moror_10832 [Moniliophthora roreri MCA 2997]|uniref:Terpene synthase n=2 Tax=Moniliophthora roreri TaxID=221103 RepID=V2X2E8_MONRO|nr:hypothetical protein Moror_10832 [Moniliophthora roreri MCA 2997]KAI3621355.1 hypothetical protein WG66_014360 [Moniliophthora roreri]
MVYTSSPSFTLPDLEGMFSILPNWGRNPYHEAAREESRRWFAEYTETTFGPKMTAFFENCEFELCMSYCYPQLDYEGLRAVVDWANILWYLDELTDTETGKDAGQTAEIVCRTLRDPCYNDGTSLCRMITDFRVNHLSRAGPETTRRFIEHCRKTFFAFSDEAELRARRVILSINDYLTLRRENGSVRNCFDLAECFMGLDLPESVYRLPDFRKAYEAAVDLVCLTNDVYSYNAEQARGYPSSNIMTVVMKEKGLGLQEASDYVGSLCRKLFDIFQASQREIQKLAYNTDGASVNVLRDALRGLEAYGHWVRGNAEWSFETERYFGRDKKKIQSSLVVVLWPANSVSRSLEQ